MKRKSLHSKSVPAVEPTETRNPLEPSRREFMAGLAGAAVLTAFDGTRAMAQDSNRAVNVARVAVPSSRTILSENKISALNDGAIPQNSFDRSHGIYALHADGPNIYAASAGGPSHQNLPWVPLCGRAGVWLAGGVASCSGTG